jgi:hypothetical protein
LIEPQRGLEHALAAAVRIANAKRVAKVYLASHRSEEAMSRGTGVKAHVEAK